MFSSQEISSGLVSFYMIFEALQSALFGFNFHSLSSKTLKIPEFNLIMIIPGPVHFLRFFQCGTERSKIRTGPLLLKRFQFVSKQEF